MDMCPVLPERRLTSALCASLLWTAFCGPAQAIGESPGTANAATSPDAATESLQRGDGERPDWRWFMGYGAVAALIAAGVWLAQQRRLELESDYRRRLEAAVRSRTSELFARNEQLKRANEKLLEASLTDPLTGLRNRRFLFEEVSKHVELIRRWHEDHGDDAEQALNIVFLIVDLDHFKSVNDRCGHAAGDQILIQARDVLLGLCRSSDFVIRWGGDEFVVVSRNAKIDQIEALAERIRSELARRVFQLEDAQIVRTTCSIGFASYPFMPSAPDLMTWEQALGLADAALYVAKRHRNAWAGYLGTQREIGYEQLLQAIRNAPLANGDDVPFEIRTSIAEPPAKRTG